MNLGGSFRWQLDEGAFNDVGELIPMTLTRKPEAATHWSRRHRQRDGDIAKSPFIACSNFSVCSLTAPVASNSRSIPSLSRSCAAWSGSISILLTRPCCFASMRRANFGTRTNQPLFPMEFGYIEGVTHGYQRYGSTTLFAALKVLDGAIIAQCKPRHRQQEFLAFLRHRS